jgi:phosphoribosyl 1,2-cyclic phosphodiesterase
MMPMTVRFWGVRGSIPTPGPDTVEFGGNTSCVQVECGDQVLVLDAGTGLRALGGHLLSLRKPVRASIFFSHVHWDHIQGLPFFGPLYVPGTQLDLYGSPEGRTLPQALTTQMGGPLFPVRLADVAARLRFHRAPAHRPVRVGEASIRGSWLNHPNGVLGYRIDCNGASVVYATDTEHTDRVDENLVDLARGADLLIYDAMFTDEEFQGHPGWGHSTWSAGVRVARAAEVGKLVLFHHDPGHSDTVVRAIEQQAATALPGTIAAREGMTLQVRARAVRALAA